MNWVVGAGEPVVCAQAPLTSTESPLLSAVLPPLHMSDMSVLICEESMQLNSTCHRPCTVYLVISLRRYQNMSQETTPSY